MKLEFQRRRRRFQRRRSSTPQASTFINAGGNQIVDICTKHKANLKAIYANLDTILSKGQSRTPQSSHFNAMGPTPEDETPTPQDFNAGGFNAVGIPKRAKVTTVLHFSNAGRDSNARGEFQRQRISTPNSGIEDPLGTTGAAGRRNGARTTERALPQQVPRCWDGLG